MQTDRERLGKLFASERGREMRGGDDLHVPDSTAGPAAAVRARRRIGGFASPSELSESANRTRKQTVCMREGMAGGMEAIARTGIDV